MEEKDAAEALLGASVDELVTAGTMLDEWANEATPGVLCFAPVVDGEDPARCTRSTRPRPARHTPSRC